MSYKTEREDFIARMAQGGIRPDVSRKLLAMSATHGRLAVASCNGDYPADNGERKVVFCPACGGGWVPSSYKRGLCPDCYIEARILAFAQTNGFAVEFQGDPRGYTVKVILHATDNYNGGEIGVPQRS
jgi:hypothetical protein